MALHAYTFQSCVIAKWFCKTNYSLYKLRYTSLQNLTLFRNLEMHYNIVRRVDRCDRTPHSTVAFQEHIFSYLNIISILVAFALKHQSKLMTERWRKTTKQEYTCLQRSSRNSEYAMGFMPLNLAMNECFMMSIAISQTYTKRAFCHNQAMINESHKLQQKHWYVSRQTGVTLMVRSLTKRKLSNQGPSASRMFWAKTNKTNAEIWNLSTESGRQWHRQKKEKL